MTTREEIDLAYGSPLYDQTPTPRPTADDLPCARCGHPQWMHAGAPGLNGPRPCHCEIGRRCECIRFVTEW